MQAIYADIEEITLRAQISFLGAYPVHCSSKLDLAEIRAWYRYGACCRCYTMKLL